MLASHFELTALYYNPNITNLEEYYHRLDELRRLCETYKVPVIDAGYSPDIFLTLAKGLEYESERGGRCKKCIYNRLQYTAQMCRDEFDYFATTLTLSPLKDAQYINNAGISMSPKYLPTDFKKGDGYRHSVEMSKSLGLYRQNYCGCEYSKRKD